MDSSTPQNAVIFRNYILCIDLKTHHSAGVACHLLHSPWSNVIIIIIITIIKCISVCAAHGEHGEMRDMVRRVAGNGIWVTARPFMLLTVTTSYRNEDEHCHDQPIRWKGIHHTGSKQGL